VLGGECVRSHTYTHSPRSFLTHHVANISTAIQTADAQTILINAASARACYVSRLGSCKVCVF
jgi:hypothetical protein